MTNTEQTICKELSRVITTHNLNHLPPHSFLKDNGYGGLANKISRNGGSGHFATLLEIPLKGGRRPPGWWTQERITEALQPYISKFERMPTANELMAEGRNDIAMALRKCGYRATAKKLGIELKKCETHKGLDKEALVMNWLSARGYSVKQTTTRAPYDLLINDCLRIEVKSATYSVAAGGYVFTFGDRGYNPPYDVYVCCAVDRASDEITAFYIIPSWFVLQRGITVTKSKKWTLWLNNWEVINDWSRERLEPLLP